MVRENAFPGTAGMGLIKVASQLWKCYGRGRVGSIMVHHGGERIYGCRQDAAISKECAFGSKHEKLQTVSPGPAPCTSLSLCLLLWL